MLDYTGIRCQAYLTVGKCVKCGQSILSFFRVINYLLLGAGFLGIIDYLLLGAGFFLIGADGLGFRVFSLFGAINLLLGFSFFSFFGLSVCPLCSNSAMSLVYSAEAASSRSNAVNNGAKLKYGTDSLRSGTTKAFVGSEASSNDPSRTSSVATTCRSCGSP